MFEKTPWRENFEIRHISFFTLRTYSNLQAFSGQNCVKITLKIKPPKIVSHLFLSTTEAFQTSLGVLWLLPDTPLTHWMAFPECTEKLKILDFSQNTQIMWTDTNGKSSFHE